MKIRILIKEKLDKIYNILPLIENNNFLKSNVSNIEYFNENNWSKVFDQVVNEINTQSKFERVCIFDDDGVLPFIYFTKQKGLVSVCPYTTNGAILSREHNNANCIIMSCKNVKIEDMGNILNIFFTTNHAGGRHATRVRLMQEPFKETNKIFLFNENKKDTILICSDHAGYAYKESIKDYLINKRKLNVIDVGCTSSNSCHYPLFAIALVLNANKASSAIAVCSSGVGIANTLNKFKGINTFVCAKPGQAKLIRSKYNANVLALGANNLDIASTLKEVDQFIDTKKVDSSFMKSMNRYGYDFDKQAFKKIDLDSKIEIPKELK